MVSDCRMDRRSTISAFRYHLQPACSAAAESVSHANAPGHDGDIASGTRNAGFADRHHPVVKLGHFKSPAVEDFVLQENNRVRITDRSLEQSLSHPLPNRAAQPSALASWAYHDGIVLAVLGGNAGGCTICPAKHDRTPHLTTPDI